MCTVSLKGGKIDHTVGGQNQFSFPNECMMIVPAETWPSTKVKICENLCVCSSKLNDT